MKIAVPTTGNNQVDGHFGHCEFYSIFAVQDAQVKEVELITASQGCGCKSNIAGELAQKGVSVMLAGGIGDGAVNVLNTHGIKLVRGCSGSVAELVKQYVEGQLIDSGINCSSHHHHGEGEHSCSH